MKIRDLITAISSSTIATCAIQGVNLSLKNGTPSALELPTYTYCNASASWLPDNKSADDIYRDCYGATLEFLRIADEHGKEIFEFHATGVRHFRRLPSKTTPLKYIYSAET